MREAELLQRLLYRDGLCLIIDKPAGLPVHAGPAGGANLEQYLNALRFGLPHPPALAHRLDRAPRRLLGLGRPRNAPSPPRPGWRALHRRGGSQSRGRAPACAVAAPRAWPPGEDGGAEGLAAASPL